jgi:hypothetical protein
MNVRLRATSTCSGQLPQMTTNRLVSWRMSLLVECTVIFIGLVRATVETFQIRCGQLVVPR